MARLFKSLELLSAYRDRRFEGTQEEFEHALRTSITVYVGNLSFYTTEEQIYEVFSRCGEIKRIIMGLDKQRKTPCGFCFVLYYTREDTEDCVKYISGTVLDERPIRVDFDWGFKEGRQFGRGRSGGQVRDEYRTDYDPGRGGYGKLVDANIQLMKQHVGLPGPAMFGPRPAFMGGPPHRGPRNGPRGSREKGEKRSRQEDAPPSPTPADGDEAPKEKNPRFRDRANESDEEEGDKK